MQQTKQLSFFAVFLLGINSIIGSGIFLLPGQIYHELGLLSLLVIFAAGLVVCLIALNYAVMSAKVSEDGGAWVYANLAFGRFWGFQVGWFGWLLGVITLSAEICALLTALKMALPLLRQSLIFNSVAVSLLLILGIANFFGVRFMAMLDDFATVAKLSVLVGFVIVGAFFFHSGNLALNLPTTIHTQANLVAAFTSAFGVIFYIFTGFNFLPIAAREMHDSKRNLPRALMLIMAVVTLLYLAVQFVVIGIMGSALSNATVPLAQAFAMIFGPVGQLVILIGMVCSILGVAVAGSFNTPIEMASLSNEKHLLPAVFGKHNRFGAPWVANMMSIGIAIVMVLSGGYLFLVKLIVLASFVQYVPTILAVIKLRRAPDLSHDFELPGGYLLPTLAFIATMYLMLSFTPTIIIWGLGMFILGSIIYLLDKWASK
ncbi:amino acid permease [Weissella diestrammenae]|uniref:Amino acid permease n=1 Tax=Weissella diestrammenae TaxID=1162633 RepID=A0A7G9T749_9LACO|nr:APC family permease [Weissella diestrammenae]MCM0582476.1 amino acid permease [Weissella diestrammenae]QNN75924.1 amino acid permease [Weissella diestrammenae]